MKRLQVQNRSQPAFGGGAKKLAKRADLASFFAIDFWGWLT